MDLGLMCLSLCGPHEEATVEEEENDDRVCCQLCGHRLGDIFVCGTCHLNMCASCIPISSLLLAIQNAIARHIANLTAIQEIICVYANGIVIMFVNQCVLGGVLLRERAPIPEMAWRLLQAMS